MNMFDLEGKVALVTGSSRGIGRSIAIQMARAGARVVVSSRKLDACQIVVDEIREGGGEAVAIACNISYRDQLEQLVAQTREALGPIDILICNAAVNPYYGPLQDTPDEAFDKIMNCNIRSNHWLCQMVLPEMAERGGGSVIIISSVTGQFGTTSLGAYAISKAADMQLTRNLAVEWGPRQIRVNCIAPGLIKTDFARALWENPKLHDAIIARYPLRRLGDPDDIAGPAIMLCSEAGRFITGQTLVIDGGGTISDSF